MSFCVLMSLLMRLKTYRQGHSSIDRIPIYCVFSDTVLRSIADARPMTMQALQSIRGLTSEKCERYGHDILRLVKLTPHDPVLSSDEPSSPVVLLKHGRRSLSGTGAKRRMLQKICVRGPHHGRTALRQVGPGPVVPAVSSASPPGEDDQIYILELAQGRVYVGRTSDMRRRLTQHLSGHGSAFTQAFAPTGTLLPRLGRVSGSAEAAERDETLRYMFLRGIPLVRGWKYTRVAMSPAEEQEAEDNIRELFNLCRRCGHPGHFVGQCRAGFDRLGRPCA